MSERLAVAGSTVELDEEMVSTTTLCRIGEFEWSS